MAVRGWGGSVATALGGAAAAGAAQLGFGYGLGIISWVPRDSGAGEAIWVASLAWATWIAAVSTVAGAVCAQRLHARSAGTPGPGSGGRRFALALAAALGALVTVALVAVPARTATPLGVESPQTVAATYAGIGALLGLLGAAWALTSPAAATNVLATGGWLWLLAVLAVGDSVLAGRGLSSAQLGSWLITAADDSRFWFRDHLYWPGAVLALGSALLIGALAARRAARHTYRRVGAAVSGTAGPLLVAVAYLLATPRLEGIRPEQLSAHLMAPYAVVAGLAGSVLVAALAQRADAVRAAGPRSDTTPAAGAGSTDTADWIASTGHGPSTPSGAVDLPRQRTPGPDPAGTGISAPVPVSDPGTGAGPETAAPGGSTAGAPATEVSGRPATARARRGGAGKTAPAPAAATGGTPTERPSARPEPADAPTAGGTEPAGAPAVGGAGSAAGIPAPRAPEADEPAATGRGVGPAVPPVRPKPRAARRPRP